MDASLSPYFDIWASSFVIIITNIQTACCGSYGVPKGSSPMDSYQSKLYGIYSIMVWLQHIVKTYEIKCGSILIVCNNKASINNAFQHKSRVNVSQGSYDLLWAIQQIHSHLPITIYYQHVKGYQHETGKHSIY